MSFSARNLLYGVSLFVTTSCSILPLLSLSPQYHVSITFQKRVFYIFTTVRIWCGLDCSNDSIKLWYIKDKKMQFLAYIMGTKWNGKDLTWLTEANDVTWNHTSHGIWTSTKVCPIPLSLLMNYKLSKSIWQNHAGLVVVHLSGSSLVQQQDVEMNRSPSCNHDDVRWTHRRHKWIPCPLFQTHESLIIHPASLGLPHIYKSVLHSAYTCIYCK
jgi:hypothetical protein